MNSFKFGTVGSPLSTPKTPGGSVGAIIRIAHLGLQAIELGWVQSVRISESTCASIKAAGNEHQVAISVHAPYYINLNANVDEWPKSRQRLLDAAYYGYLAGATDIVFHPGSYFGLPAEEVLLTAKVRLKECANFLLGKGVQVTLRPETMGKSALLGSLEDTLELSRSIEGVEPCLDFAHLHARRGDGSLNTAQEWGEILNIYASVLGDDALKRLHIHLSGIEYSAKGEKNHLPIQESDFNLKGLFQALRVKDCGGRILCESPILEDDALMMQSLWNKIG